MKKINFISILFSLILLLALLTACTPPEPPVFYNITVNPEVANGVISFNKIEAEAGDTITITVTPNEGYRLVEGSLNCQGTTVSNLSFVMPHYDVEVSAQFERVYTITLGEMQNGTLTLNVTEAALFETIIVTAVPAEGYRIKENKLYYNNAYAYFEFINHVKQFSMFSSNITIFAEFEPIPDLLVLDYIEFKNDSNYHTSNIRLNGIVFSLDYSKISKVGEFNYTEPLALSGEGDNKFAYQEFTLVFDDNEFNLFEDGHISSLFISASLFNHQPLPHSIEGQLYPIKFDFTASLENDYVEVTMIDTYVNSMNIELVAKFYFKPIGE